MAQAQSAGAPKSAAAASDSGDSDYSKWDITPYFGWQWFQAFQGNNDRNYAAKYQSGWLFGESFDANFSNHVSAEASMTLGRDRLDLRPSTQTTFASVITYNTQFALDLVYHFQPRSAKTRMYIKAGPDLMLYTPKGSSGNAGARGNFVQPVFAMKRRDEPAVNYAIGVKHYVNRIYGMQFEIGGRLGPKAHYNLPSAPTGPNSIYIPYGGKDSSLYASVGVILREGYVAPPPPPNPLVSQSIRVDMPAVPTGAPTISGAHDVCPGDDLRLAVNANGFPNPSYQWRVNGAAAAAAGAANFSVPTTGQSGSRSVVAVVTPGPTVATSAPFATSAGHTYHLTAEPQGLNGRNATYQWMVNGAPVAGATSSSYDLPDAAPASVTVQVKAANPPVNSSPANFNLNALSAPNLTFAVNPGTVPYSSGPIALRASATQSSPCNGNITTRYSGEAVNGTSFNPGQVSGFDMGNRLRPQTKTVTITATATDAHNQSVTKTAPVTVTLDPEARRLDDVVFPNMSARVNNCGKRLLLEELTPMLRNDPGAKVVLIGHRADNEKGRTGTAMDTTRVLNAAAVLSAGKGICPQLDLSRILMKADGTDQSATPRPSFCGSSTDVKEKSGQSVKESDKNAEFRRVEVWIIPGGAAMPAGVAGATPVDSAAISKLGCPK
jgi:hypothetical protein